MKKINLYLLFFLFMSAQLSFADNQFNCPNTFKTVSVGAMMDQVQAACGSPTKVATANTQINEPINLIQWVYFPAGFFPQSNTQFTPQLIITFRDNQAINISTNNQTTSAAFPCLQFNRINIGNTMSFVKQQCGRPKFVNHMQQSNTRDAVITQWTYNFGRYRPQMIFTFINGKLTQMNRGQLG